MLANHLRGEPFQLFLLLILILLMILVYARPIRSKSKDSGEPNLKALLSESA
jgi:hypothetical protein